MKLFHSLKMWNIVSKVVKMIKGIEELSKQLGHSESSRGTDDPTVRRILQAYIEPEMADIDKMVYAPLQEKYPHLRKILDENDVRGRYRGTPWETRSLLDSLDSIVGDVMQLQRYLEESWLSRFIFGIRRVRLDILTEFSDGLGKQRGQYVQLAKIQEEVYMGIANAIREIASKRNISHEDVVRNQEYRDEIMKKIFPTRQEAEAYFGIGLQVKMETALSLERTIDDLKAELRRYKNKLSQLPTVSVGDIAIINEAMSRYRATQFDRIYATKG